MERSIDLILEGTLPTQSKDSHVKAWRDFKNKMEIEGEPTEDLFLYIQIISW